MGAGAAAAQPPASLGPPAPAASPHSARMCGQNSEAAPRDARSRSRSPSSAVASISAYALLPGRTSAAAVAAFSAVRDLSDENVAVRDGKTARRSAALAASHMLRALSQWPHLAPPSAELVQMLRNRLAREKSEISSLAAADAVCAGLTAGGVEQAAIASLSPRPPPAWRAPLSPLPVPSTAFLGSLSAPGVYMWGGTGTVMND